MPGLTLQIDTSTLGAPSTTTANNTAATHTSSHSDSRTPAHSSSSPTRPPVSPITPTLASAQLPSFTSTSFSSSTVPSFSSGGDGSAPPVTSSSVIATTTAIAPATAPAPTPFGGRQTFIHSQPDQVGIPAPPPHPHPITLDENPDANALRSAISILQLQRQRSAADIQALGRARNEALADPAAFAQDLGAGRVRMRGDPLFGGEFGDDDDDSSDDSDSDDNNGNAPGSTEEQDQTNTRRNKKAKTKTEKARAWESLPSAQTVVRCPPINWAQYAVVGESLDKLHAEQVAMPTQGAPMAVSIDAAGQVRYPGVAQPYAPGKDKIQRKPNLRG